MPNPLEIAIQNADRDQPEKRPANDQRPDSRLVFFGPQTFEIIHDLDHHAEKRDRNDQQADIFIGLAKRAKIHAPDFCKAVGHSPDDGDDS